MAKKYQNNQDPLDIDPFLGYREEIIKRRGESDAPRAFGRKSRKQSRRQAEAMKLLVLKWFQLVEPNIFWVKDTNVLTTSQYRGTEVFDIKAYSRQSLVNPHLELGIMRKDKLRVLMQHRRGYEDDINVTLPLSDFEAILDGLALLYAENISLNGGNPLEYTREQLYKEGVTGTIKSLLKARNKEGDPLHGYSVKRFVRGKFTSKRPLSMYDVLDGLSYRHQDDWEDELAANYCLPQSSHATDWHEMRTKLKKNPVKQVNHVSEAINMITYRQVLQGKMDSLDYRRQSLLSRYSEYYYMWRRENPKTAYVWKKLCDMNDVRVQSAHKYMLYWRPSPSNLDINRFANKYKNEPLAKTTFGELKAEDVRRELKKLSDMKLIKLETLRKGLYEITFTYYHKDTKQNVVRSHGKYDRLGNKTPHYLL